MSDIPQSANSPVVSPDAAVGVNAETRSAESQRIVPKMVFLVGCPRSGTTWLQLLLAQHPQVATLEETHLFPEYVSPMLANRRKYHGKQRKVGLDAILDDCEFRTLCQSLVMQVLRIALEGKPGATVILEKTPGHLYHAENILELFPEASFVHLIRDPRAVVASLLNAARTWGRSWAPGDAQTAADTWCRAVERGREIRSLTERYVEVTYEALHENTAQQLHRILDAIQISYESDFCERSAVACSREHLKEDVQSIWSPISMRANLGAAVRRGEVNGWRSELDPMEVTTVEQRASELMQELGYAPLMLRNGSPPFRWHVHHLLDRAIRVLKGRT